MKQKLGIDASQPSVDFLRLKAREEHDPHMFLGLHTISETQKLLRLWRPGAESLYFELFGSVQPALRVSEEGLFETPVPPNTTFRDYRIYHQNGLLAADPYAFYPTLGDVDLYLFGTGVHYRLWKVLGAHPVLHQETLGVKFAVWAPNAKSVSLVGDFNHWDGRINPMRVLGSSGVWELFIPGLPEGEKYKFEIKTQTGETLLKSDPYGHSHELRPATASIVADITRFIWSDQEWMAHRKQQSSQSRPINIYEVHLGSWKRKDGWFLNYRQLAEELISYCKEMGFTHVELLPIQEHPLDESWGYQVTGYYGITSRYGSPSDFQWFVNELHRHQIGVLLDWVPGHFPTDSTGLGCFDGTALYEHVDSRQGLHPHWNTYLFNFGRHEVSNFLIANALFWLEEMHIDGLRVDAVASMLYLDYGREPGEWIPNPYGTHENLDAIEFLKHLNSIVHQHIPDVWMIAEESTSFPRVSFPVQQGGLGFDFKWNMGWMNDTLRYFSKDMLYRSHHHNDLTFGLLYAFSERFILVFSHDEVVHGKSSLLGKMPGDIWQKFANLRLLYSYMICQPGKKLLFMGGEIAQWNEWVCSRELEWELLRFIPHQEMQRMVRDINHLYLQHPALWERDDNYTGFSWIDFSDTENSVIVYLRKSEEETLLCVHSFTPSYHPAYFVRLEGVSSAEEIFSSDNFLYGGSGKLTHAPQILYDAAGRSAGVQIVLAPLATMIFKIRF